MDKKKIMEPARLTLVVDSKEVREYLLKEERYAFYEGYRKKLLRRNRIGIEPIDTDTFDSDVYFEMFRMIGDKSACQPGSRRFSSAPWRNELVFRKSVHRASDARYRWPLKIEQLPPMRRAQRWELFNF